MGRNELLERLNVILNKVSPRQGRADDNTSTRQSANSGETISREAYGGIFKGSLFDMWSSHLVQEE